MRRLRLVWPSIDRRRRVARWHARCILAVRFAWLGWRLGGLRERIDYRRESLTRVLGR